MMNGMPAQESPEAPPQGGMPPAKQIVTAIHSNLVMLAEIMDQSPNIPDEDKSQLADIINQFQMFASSKLGGKAGAPPPSSPKPVPSNVPMEAGNNPNARPM